MTTDPTARLHEAAAHLQSGNPTRALAIVDPIVRADPRDAEAGHLLALSLSRLGDVARATAAFEAAAALHPRKDIILANLGHHLRNAGQPEAAADAFERALQHNARNSAALNGLGNFAAARGKNAEAADYYERAMAAAPRSPVAYVNRGASLRSLGRLEESLAALDRAIVLAPSLPEAFFQRAATLRTLGRVEDAIAAYRKALTGAPERADIHRELAGLLFEAGRAGEAFAALDAVISGKPSPGLVVLRGELALLVGDISAAADCAQRALSMAPDHAQAHGLEAKSARLSGLMERALAAARRATDLAPDDFTLLHLCCEIELAMGNAPAAVRRLQGVATPAHLQKHIALKATAMRIVGDPGYRLYYDYDRLTAQVAVDPPPGFASIATFNEALANAIAPLHRTNQRPLDQTLFGGTQSPGRLWNEPDPIIRLYAETMLSAARAFVAQLAEDPSHPFLARKNSNLECAGAWSVMLSSGGGHVDHIHPAGWISACYYVQSPPEIFDGECAGYLRLGASGVAGVALPAERYYPPTPGTVVFFPSYVWHGVEPFEAATPRITAPFDLAPISP